MYLFLSIVLLKTKHFVNFLWGNVCKLLQISSCWIVVLCTNVEITAKFQQPNHLVGWFWYQNYCWCPIFDKCWNFNNISATRPPRRQVLVSKWLPHYILQATFSFQTCHLYTWPCLSVGPLVDDHIGFLWEEQQGTLGWHLW